MAGAAGRRSVAASSCRALTSAVRVVRGARRARGWPFVELDTDGVRRALLLVWLGGVWLSYATSSSDRVYPHYLITVYPISFAVPALGLSDLVGSPERGPCRGRLGRSPCSRRAGRLRCVHARVPAVPRERRRRGRRLRDRVRDSQAVANAVRARRLGSPTTRCSTSSSPGRMDAPVGSRTLVTVTSDSATPPLPRPRARRTAYVRFASGSACRPPRPEPDADRPSTQAVATRRWR